MLKHSWLFDSFHKYSVVQNPHIGNTSAYTALYPGQQGGVSMPIYSHLHIILCWTTCLSHVAHYPSLLAGGSEADVILTFESEMTWLTLFHQERSSSWYQYIIIHSALS